MGRIEMILKIVMTPVEDMSTFVEHACKLVPDCDLVEFGKVLDMKGFKKPEHVPFVEEFKTKCPRQGLSGGEVGTPETGVESSRIKKLEKLIKKRL